MDEFELINKIEIYLEKFFISRNKIFSILFYIILFN